MLLRTALAALAYHTAVALLRRRSDPKSGA